MESLRREVVSFPEPLWLRRIRENRGFFALVPRALFRVAGSDAARYLGGQLSVDVNRIPADASRFACLLTAKGKLVALVLVWRSEADFFIEAPASLRDEVAARLERYIIADDVTVTDETSPGGYHLVGGGAGQPGRIVSRIGLPGRDVEQKPDGIAELLPVEIESIRIFHGIPAWGSELDADTLPQEARLDEWAVDFDKGCYVGQEVVSRLRSVGRVNRRLCGFSGNVESGGDTFLLKTPEGMEAGCLTSRYDDLELARTLALGYVHRSFDGTSAFEVVGSEGESLGQVERRELPIR